LLPHIPVEKVDSIVRDGIKAISARYPSLNVAWVKERMNPGLDMPVDHELLNICKTSMEEVGLEPAFAKKATSTEASQYFQAGYPAVIVGPGKSQGNSHSPNENNILEQLEKAIDFYERVIEKVCL